MIADRKLFFPVYGYAFITQPVFPEDAGAAAAPGYIIREYRLTVLNDKYIIIDTENFVTRRRKEEFF